MQSVSVTMNVTDEIVSLNSHWVGSSVRVMRLGGHGRRNRRGCLPGAYPGKNRLLSKFEMDLIYWRTRHDSNV